MKRKLFLIFLALIEIVSYGQINFVKNWDFQNGDQTPLCAYCFNCQSGVGICSNDLIEEDIYDWYNCKTEDKCPYCNIITLGKNCPTADWIEKNNCAPGLTIDGFPILSPSTRFVGLDRQRPRDQSWGTIAARYKNYEGVRSELTNKIQGWTDYIFRFKMAAQRDTSYDREQRIILSKQGSTWYRDHNNSKLEIGVFKLPANFNHKWYTFEKKFSTSIHNEMQQLIIIRNKDDEFGYLFIDKVELYEYCPLIMPIQGRLFDSADLYDIYETPLPMEAKTVRAGYNVTPLLPNGDVTCQALSKVVFKAENQVILEAGFKIERGANFRAYIAPCGVVCPIPSAYVANDTVMCGQQGISFPIGGAEEIGVSYTWASEPPGGLVYLNNPTISNPTFTVPSGLGTLKYTVTATSACGGKQTRSITISYSSLPVAPSSFTLTGVINYDSLQFQLTSLHPQTEKVKVQMLSCDGLDTLWEDIFTQNQDFVCCSLSYKNREWLYPCDCYKVRIATKNYCNDTWKDTIISYSRNNTLDYAPLTNVGSCEKDEICFKLKGATSIHYYVYNRWGQKIDEKNVNVNDDTMCFNIKKAPAGTYFIQVNVTDCNNDEHNYSSYPFAILCDYPMIGNPHPTKWDEQYRKVSNTLSDSGVNQSSEYTIDTIACIVFPNPATNELNIAYTNTGTEPIEISLIDMLGKTVVSIHTQNPERGTNMSKINVSEIRDGVYLLLVKIGDRTKTERVTIASK